MSPVGFQPTIPASARPQTYASDRAATGIGEWSLVTILDIEFDCGECSWSSVGRNVENNALVCVQKSVMSQTMRATVLEQNTWKVKSL
jgi:hypothetical protein